MSELIFYDESVVNKIYFLLVKSGFPVLSKKALEIQDGPFDEKPGYGNRWERQNTERIDSFFLSFVGECFAFNKSRLKVVFQDSIIRL